MSLYGKSDLGDWISAKYLHQYGMTLRVVRTFGGRMVYVRTDKGLWRPDAKGYTSNPADAGLYRFEPTWESLKDLGPEKHLCFIRPATKTE